MKKFTRIAVILIVVALLWAAFPALVYAAGAQSITRTFAASRDTYIDQGQTIKNFGLTTELWVRTYKTSNYRVLVYFDLSQLPSDSTVTAATLYLYMKAAPSTTRDYDSHRLTQDWTEGDDSDNSGATWNRYDGTSDWATAGGGGDFAAAATATKATGALNSIWLDWNVQADVALFAGGTANYGWIIKDNVEGSNSEKKASLQSREYGSEMPYLEVTYTAPWDSYEDTARNTVRDTFTGSYGTVYMEGTGFLDGTQTYNVSYYDAGDAKITTDAAIALVNVSGGRGTLGNPSSPYEPTYTFIDNPTAQAGTWHAVAQPSGATAFPTSYSTLSAAPDTYELIADDTFTVNQDVIPEFPIVFAAIAVAGLCFGIYWWMRRRRLASYKVTG